MAIDKLRPKHFPMRVVNGTKVAAHDILTDEDIMNKINEVIDCLWRKGFDIEPGEIDVDPNTGHDYQCNIDVVKGQSCDCWRNEELQKKSKEILARMAKKRKVKKDGQ